MCPDTYKELGQAPGVIASDAVARRVVEQCVVAHGSIQHTIMERMFGVDMYSRIAARPIATTVPEWLRCYSAAHASAGAAEGCPLPAAPAAAPRLCVFLDVKSTRAPAAALRALIRGLNLYGIAVWGAGSFVHHQLEGIDEVEQEVHGVGSASSVVRLPPALPLHIYTSAGEIQRSVLSGKLPRGASVLFNGSSLLKSKLHPSDAAATQASYVIDEPVVAELCALAAAHDVHLGYYTQEVVLDTVAYSLLVKIAHAYRGTFDLGFNYSNLPGVAAADIKPSAAMATTGLVIPAIWRPLVYKAWTLSAPAK
ncbi:hypothetical protein EON66_11470 [archaeon]|nr:MAG: hypothetical protein EON66_11470 [archaeon]